MNENHPHDPSDADLLRSYRSGDAPAAGMLDDRHGPEALRLADCLLDQDEADGLVDDAFQQVLRAIRAGDGPEVAFRPALLTTLVALGPERVDPDGLLRQAFSSLPERWRAVLWHTAVHAEDPQHVARILGMAPSVVTSLEIQGREGLRRAYLATHLDRAGSQDCEDVREMIPAFARDMLTDDEVDVVEDHLDDCAECREAAIVLGGEIHDLGLVLAPAMLGKAGLEAFGEVGARSPRALAAASAAAVDEAIAASAAAAVVAEPPAEAPAAPVVARPVPSRSFTTRKTSAPTAADLVAQAEAEKAAQKAATTPPAAARSARGPQHAGAPRPAAAPRQTQDAETSGTKDVGIAVFGGASDAREPASLHVGDMSLLTAERPPSSARARLGAFWARRGRLSTVATVALVAVGGVSMVGLWGERSSANDRDLGALSRTLDLLPTPTSSSADASPSASPSATEESVEKAPASAPATSPPVASSPTAVATKAPEPEPEEKPETPSKPSTSPSATQGQDLSLSLTGDYSVRGFGRVSLAVNAPGVSPTVSVSAPRGASAYAYGGGMRCSGQGGDRLTCTGSAGSSGLTIVWRGGDDATLKATVSAGGNKDPRPGNNSVSTG